MSYVTRDILEWKITIANPHWRRYEVVQIQLNIILGINLSN